MEDDASSDAQDHRNDEHGEKRYCAQQDTIIYAADIFEETVGKTTT